MKIRRKLYLCQRKQSSSHHNGNCWRTLPFEGRIFFPKNKTKPTTKQQSFVNYCVWHRSTYTNGFLPIKCQFKGAEEEEILRLGERLMPLSSPAWTTCCPFLREGNGKQKWKKKKSQQGRSFVSGTLDWLVSCYNQNMLSWTMYETSEEKAVFAIILH